MARTVVNFTSAGQRERKLEVAFDGLRVENRRPAPLTT
jgi:hypothetical protein